MIFVNTNRLTKRFFRRFGQHLIHLQEITHGIMNSFTRNYTWNYGQIHRPQNCDFYGNGD